MSTTLNVMIVGGAIHQFEECHFNVESGWLIVTGNKLPGDHRAVYAEHRTVRAWYSGAAAPKIIEPKP